MIYSFVTEYVAPQTIGIITSLFILWSAGLVFMAIRLIRAHRSIHKFSAPEAIDFIVEAIRGDEEPKERGSQDAVKDIGEDGGEESDEFGDDDDTEEERAPDRQSRIDDTIMRIHGNPVVSEHVKTIATAGYRESQIDVGELLRHSSSRLFGSFPSIGFLRVVLSTFIILGLLGTLGQLAVSLGSFSDTFGVSVQKTQEEVGVASQSLLSGLKSAFDPSIIGVFATIIGVIFLGALTYYANSLVRKALERATLDHWVPNFLPTTPQRLLETLKRSEDQLHKNREAAERVAAFAQGIENETEILHERLPAANAMLESLHAHAKSMTTLTDGFINAVSNLGSFEEKFLELHEDLNKKNVLFGETVREISERTHRLFSEVDTLLRSQAESIKEIGLTLGLHRSDYLERAGKLEEASARIHTNLDAIEKMHETLNADIEEKHKLLIEKMIENLTENVGAPLKDELASGLKAVVDRFNVFDTPIKEAAADIRRVANSLGIELRAISEKLKESYEKEREAIQEEFAKRHGEIGETLGKQLEELEKIHELQDSMIASSARMAEATSQIGHGTERISSSTKELTGQVTALTKAVDKIPIARRHVPRAPASRRQGFFSRIRNANPFRRKRKYDDD